MARVSYGSYITELKGSIGGVTFHRNTSGPIAKLRPLPPCNPSDIQGINQAFLSRAVATWATLSLAEKDNWNVIAAAHPHENPWGESKTLNGYQWFISASLNLLVTGQAYPPGTPTWIATAPPDQFTLTASSTYLKLIWASTWYPTTNYSLLYCSPPLRQASLKIRRSLFTLSMFGSSAKDEIDITAYFESYFNVSWPAFYASANCNILVHLKQIQEDEGWASAFTSSIVKIG